jgi:apolipoprotein D and lipocalin family protein
MKIIASFIMLLCASTANSYSYVEELDLEKYQGTWYEAYDNLFDQTFQKGGSCVRADYTINNEGTVDVLNREVNIHGDVESIVGKAYYEDGNYGGQLTVDLEGTPFPAPYWVIELGPIVNDQYDYSIVSDDKQISLFVLARNVTEFFEKYDYEVLQSIYDFGFTSYFNEPRVVYQENCPY